MEALNTEAGNVVFIKAGGIDPTVADVARFAADNGCIREGRERGVGPVFQVRFRLGEWTQTVRQGATLSPPVPVGAEWHVPEVWVEESRVPVIQAVQTSADGTDSEDPVNGPEELVTVTRTRTITVPLTGLQSGYGHWRVWRYYYHTRDNVPVDHNCRVPTDATDEVAATETDVPVVIAAA